MTQQNERSLPESLISAIQTQHPGLGEEIEEAIGTLRKLQQITGTPPSGEQDQKQRIIPRDGTEHLVAPHQPNAQLLKTADTEVVHAVQDHQAENRPVPTLVPRESFGRYQIVRMLGKGAMGAVYLAYDSQLQRHVALKTPFVGNSPGIIERFHREARAAAQLRSPYLCPIYDVGQIGEIHYLSMAFIDGQSLGRTLSEGKLKEETEIAALLQKIARGLQKAHENGIIHRDLKPENIMVDNDGEPIVMDFGLARRVDDDIQFTSPGRILGTPAYMSPEQVEGDSIHLGPPTDIYSLGVVLFVMLTGQVPFQGSLTSVLRKIAGEDPPRPSAINSNIAPNSPLEQICLKMMAKIPAERPASMAEVAHALENLNSPSEIRVPKISFWKRGTSWLWQRLGFLSRTVEVTRPSVGESLPAVENTSPIKKTPKVLENSQTMDSPSSEAVAPGNVLNDSHTMDLGSQLDQDENGLAESSKKMAHESGTVDVENQEMDRHQDHDQTSQTIDSDISLVRN